jgi:cyclase
LLLKNEGLVKTRKFKKPMYVGDPTNAIRIFNEKEVDELIVLDVEASKRGVEPNYQMVEQIAGECFMPLAYGGGIVNVDQARQLFSLGVEKICLQTAAIDCPSMVTELANKFGTQSITVSVDVKRDWLGRTRLYRAASKELMSKSWIDSLKASVSAGAGEILLNSVDKDGTLSGPDLQIISEASDAIDVPLIALGGISSLSDIKDCVTNGASGVAAGAYFVYYGPHRAVLITYPKRHELEDLF